MEIDRCRACGEIIGSKPGSLCVCSGYALVWPKLSDEKKMECHKEMESFYQPPFPDAT